MLIDKYFSQFRILRLRMRYYYNQAKLKYRDLTFMWDSSKKFKLLKDNLKKRNITKAVILGNASNLNALDKNIYNSYYQDKNILTIGLNNSFLLYETDFILWGEYFVMKKLLQTPPNKQEKHTFIFVSQLLDAQRKSLKYWKKHKDLHDYPLDTLFKARTILISALYLCYELNIKEIELYGVSMDDYSHFYTPKGEKNTRTTFEFLSKKKIEEQFYGYTVHKIVKEISEYLINNGFNISYGGTSDFLSSIKGIKQINA